MVTYYSTTYRVLFLGNIYDRVFFFFFFFFFFFLCVFVCASSAKAAFCLLRGTPLLLLCVSNVHQYLHNYLFFCNIDFFSGTS
jgi:hypothetical protein